MNASAVARHYDRLTPEERFRLIVAAGARRDKAEQERLVNSGGRLALSMSDHAPYGHAFDELAVLVFIELVEEAARYHEVFERAEDARDIFGVGAAGEESGPSGHDQQGAALGPPDPKDPPEDGEGRRPWERYIDLGLAAGYVLKTKAHGWVLFCERQSIPPFALWQGLPGFDRLQSALVIAEQVAFTPEGFLRWFNEVRPEGKPEATEIPLTVEGMAKSTAAIFRRRVKWWGG